MVDFHEIDEESEVKSSAILDRSGELIEFEDIFNISPEDGKRIDAIVGDVRINDLGNRAEFSVRG